MNVPAENVNRGLELPVPSPINQSPLLFTLIGAEIVSVNPEKYWMVSPAAAFVSACAVVRRGFSRRLPAGAAASTPELPTNHVVPGVISFGKMAKSSPTVPPLPLG